HSPFCLHILRSYTIMFHPSLLEYSLSSRYPFNAWLSKRFSIVEPHFFGLMLAVFQPVTYVLF
ncbi:MAG: hypothetical protein ACK48D_21220, partial [Pseudanabaena sp.]